MTVIELNELLGRIAVYKIGDLQVNVLIVNARKVWNRIDVQIDPCSGTGRQWVSLDSVTVKGD
jgi:hypothetical protein